MSETNDFEQRKAQFIEKYGKLVEEYKCDFFAFPIFIPAEDKSPIPIFKVGLQQQVVDTSNLPTKSPFVA